MMNACRLFMLSVLTTKFHQNKHVKTTNYYWYSIMDRANTTSMPPKVRLDTLRSTVLRSKIRNKCDCQCDFTFQTTNIT